MARFAANAAGDIIQLIPTYQQEKTTPLPTGAVFSLSFDEITNTGIITSYNQNSEQFRMDGGTVTQNGTEVTVNPPSLFYEAFSSRASMLAKANSDDAHTWTTEEVDRLVGVVFRIAGLE